MAESLKKQAFVGVGWNALGSFSTQGVNFVLQIILARLLSPSDYGIIAMMAIFLQVAAVFVDSGFGKALVQKKDCEEKDYSTVFYYNLAVSIGIYIILFAISPLVARFYDIPILTDVMRVASLVVIINALSIVQRTKLEKSIDFKSRSIVTFVSSLLSGVAGIIMAYYGFGVWALCGQSLLNSLLQLVFFYLYVRWLPSLVFSKESFHEMFSFGSKLLATNIINVIYSNLYTIVIGKRFNSRDLGFYSRADQFAIFPSTNLCGVISGVAFPTLSKIQDDDDKLRFAYRKIIRYSSFIIFPLMIGLAAVADPFIRALLGEKWAETIPYLQILCFALMWDHLSSLNLNLLFVKGKSNLVLKLEIIKKSIALFILFASIPFGITIMCCGRVIYGMIAFYINTSYTKKLIGLSFWQQVMDFLPYLVISLGMGVLVFFICAVIPVNPIWSLIIGLLVGAVAYLSCTLLFLEDVREETKLIIRRVIK